jgi:hypothetical protein
MICRAVSWLIAAGGLSLATFGQDAPRLAPIPSDPLELVTGQVHVVGTPARREAILQLLDRARNSYALRKAGRAYDLKVSFTVDSGGQTEYDGAWEMEDVFDPQQGLRWTAAGAGGYTTTQISSKKRFYEDGTANTIPLRLHEARAALFDPIPSSGNAARALIRTSSATFNGVQVTCVLLSASGSAATAMPGRAWEESEECIDPQSGLLQVQSQVPGRYYAYDYSNVPQLGGCRLPRKVTVTEAGKIVSAISVDSLKELSTADPSLFVPTGEMKGRGPAIAMAGAQKMSLDSGPNLFSSGGTVRPVCVFGLVMPTGQLVEAHSLQPSDPNSQAAVEAAKRMNFLNPAPPGARPQQHFVFVIEKFVSSPQ